ncbi:MAG: hypothetical protein QXR19_10095 [Candidatus Jordarchaeaceae archaeon]
MRCKACSAHPRPKCGVKPGKEAQEGGETTPCGSTLPPNGREMCLLHQFSGESLTEKLREEDPRVTQG